MRNKHMVRGIKQKRSENGFDKDDRDLVILYIILAFETFLITYYGHDQFMTLFLTSFVMPVESGITFFWLGKH